MSSTTSHAPQTEKPLPTLEYHDIPTLQQLVLARREALAQGRSRDQYYLVRGVPSSDFQKLDDETCLIGARLQYDFDTEDLIVKLMPGLEHELVHTQFMRKLDKKLSAMGLSDEAVSFVGSATYIGNSRAKQGDAGIRPVAMRNRDEWPTVVVECGISESLARLRIDAHWWIANSAGDVKVVIIVALDVATRNFVIEKWQPGAVSASGPMTRARSGQPIRTASIGISEQPPTNDFVASDNLVINFKDLMLCDPIPPQQDIVFTRQELEAWAKFVLDM